MERELTVKVTDDGYEVVLRLDTQTFVEKWKFNPTGAKCMTSELGDNDSLPEDLRDELNETDFYSFAKILRDADSGE